MSSSDPFDVQVELWVAQQMGRATQAYRAVAQAAVARVKELTPVDTGYLRANWTAVVSGGSTTIDGRPAGAAGGGIEQAILGDHIVILNPVVYARRIEYGFVGTDSRGRHFNQAGVGMLQQTIAELPGIANRAITRVIGGA